MPTLLLALAVTSQAAPVAWDAGGGANTNWHIEPTSLNWNPPDTDPTAADDVTFNSTGAVANGIAAITNTVNQDFTIKSLTYSQTTDRHNTSIGSGISLNVSGGNVGVTNGTVFMTGGGTFNQTTSGGIFQIGSDGLAATLDMSGLGVLNANLGTTGTFRIGQTNASSGATSPSNMTLAATRSRQEPSEWATSWAVASIPSRRTNSALEQPPPGAAGPADPWFSILPAAV